MKRLQVLFLVALSSSLLLFGCGKKEEETAAQPIVEPIVETQPQKEEERTKQKIFELKEITIPEMITVKDLALYPVEYLKKDFGVIGIDWHMHANGLDFSKLSEKYNNIIGIIARN